MESYKPESTSDALFQHEQKGAVGLHIFLIFHVV